MQSLRLVAIAAVWIVAAQWACAQGAALGQERLAAVAAAPTPGRQSLRMDEGTLVLEVQLDGYVLPGGVLAYQDGSHVLLPLGELAHLLTLAISVSPGTGSATGQGLLPGHTFFLDTVSARVRINGVESTFDPRQVQRMGDDIVVASGLLSRWLAIDFAVQLPTMQLRVFPHAPLPLQARLARERAAAYLIEPQAQVLDAGYPFVPLPYRPMSAPFIDQTFGTDVRTGNGSRQTRASYTAYLTADVLGMEGAAYLSTSNDTLSPDWRWTLGRNDPNAGLLEPLGARTVQIGSVVLPSVHNIAVSSPKGLGATLSNRHLDQAASFDRETLRGDLPPGWDVTLYFNDALIDYQASRADGLYVFESLPLSFGRNEFVLIFNGPLGQNRTERKSYRLDQLVVQPGELLYSLGQLQAQSGALLSTAAVEWGLTKTMAAHVGAARMPLARSGETVGFATVGLRSYFDGAIVTAEYAPAQRGGALAELGLKTGLGRYALDLVHTHAVGDYESDLFPLDGVRRSSLVQLQGTLAGLGLPPLPMSLTAQRQVLASGLNNDAASGRLSVTVGATSITQGLSWQRLGGEAMSSSTLQMYRRMANTSVSGQLAYAIQPDARLDSLTVVAHRQVGQNFNLTAGLSHQLRLQQTLLSVGLSKQFDAFTLTLSGAHSSSKEYALGLMVSMAMGRDPRSETWKFDPLPMAATGAVSARVFVDRNMNGAHDSGEELIPNAGFVINSGGRSPVRTDDAGVALIRRLAVNQYTDLALDARTLEDPLWKSIKPGVRLLPRPGGVQTLEFPVVSTSEIDGTVSLLEKGKRRGVGDARVELLDESGNLVASTTSTSDGFYLLTQLLPGQFTLRMSPQQLAKAQLRAGHERPMTIRAEGDFISGQDFELQLLAR